MCTRLEPILLRINITDENGTTYGEELEIKDGEDPADMLYHHTKDTNITHEIKHKFLIQNICTALPPGTCKRDRALLFSAPIGMNGKSYPKFELYDLPIRNQQILYGIIANTMVLKVFTVKCWFEFAKSKMLKS